VADLGDFSDRLRSSGSGRPRTNQPPRPPRPRRRER